MTTLRKQTVRTDNPREVRARELVISISQQVIEHALGGTIKCEHCKELLKHLENEEQ